MHVKENHDINPPRDAPEVAGHALPDIVTYTADPTTCKNAEDTASARVSPQEEPGLFPEVEHRTPRQMYDLEAMQVEEENYYPTSESTTEDSGARRRITLPFQLRRLPTSPPSL